MRRLHGGDKIADPVFDRNLYNLAHKPEGDRAHEMLVVPLPAAKLFGDRERRDFSGLTDRQQIEFLPISRCEDVLDRKRPPGGYEMRYN